ncbi:MAG TPA: iron-sulfur cluster carrier protein ApbC [Caldithrix abyssi]|uniref:Iron-sulfur cluster carrier protein n=1 Tax=Caldithrix abyssi TaxID=187145 RepID=A0A7V5PPU3_CALAY|nr:iron-sulfur cluster carrier protein ApbC [Caldithrix abyssi]
MASKEQVVEALKEVNYPGFTRDIVSFGIVQKVDATDNSIYVQLLLKTNDTSVGDKIKQDVDAHLKQKFDGHSVQVDVQTQAPPQFSTQPQEAKPSYLPSVKYKVAVASGKGGVGKSTVAVNLALALAKVGMSVGLLDADIYGPSIPMMLGVDEKPYYDGKKIYPIQKYGVELMSLGFLVDSNEAVIWRGALVHRALQQLMNDVAWPELDIILFDMPPGTGDAQLTLSQSVALDGAVIVSTPQDVALIDAVKGVNMFRKVNVPILGIVENMSYFVCPHCGERTDIFSSGGAKRECEKLDTTLLGEIPLDAEIRIGGDEGKPIVVKNPDSPQTKAFLEIAERIKKELTSA